jgi:branched-chain amino acid transport system permease protein
MDIRRYMPVAILIAVLAGLQIVMTASGAEYFLTQLTMTAYYAVVIIGLCLLMGYAGQLSLGHAAFFAIGGYVTAVLSTYNLAQIIDPEIQTSLINIGILAARETTYGTRIVHVSSWLSFIAAISSTIVIAFMIGIPVLKLKGHYLAMATLGFGTIIYRVLLGTKIFGEADGISNVPGFRITDSFSVSGDASSKVGNYYFAIILVAAGMAIALNLVKSRVGRALRSIHGSEEAANAMGVNTARYKLYLFVLSAVYASAAGFFLTHYNGGIGPSEANIMKSVRYVAIVAVGGMASLWGCLIMGLALNFLSLRGYFGSYDDAVFGSILILFMLFAPEGILRRDTFESMKNFVKYLSQKVQFGKTNE